ncbi:MAG: hypothetical protein ACXWDJ_12110, partial [Aeromicrobium sp.]
GARAPLIALQLLGSVEDKNTPAGASSVSSASVISGVAVLFAKETAKTSLRHDGVVPGAHK